MLKCTPLIALASMFLLIACEKEATPEPQLPLIDRIVGEYQGDYTLLSCQVPPSELSTDQNASASVLRGGEEAIQVTIRSGSSEVLLEFDGNLATDSTFLIPLFLNADSSDTYRGTGKLVGERLQVSLTNGCSYIASGGGEVAITTLTYKGEQPQ
jgi:hypothetical protein